MPFLILGVKDTSRGEFFAVARTGLTFVAVDGDLDFQRNTADEAVDVCYRRSVKLFVR
jgi:hypothetical protein